MPTAPAEYPILLFADQAAWTAWLERHGASERGVWLRLAKKGSALRSLSYAEALDSALCHGWIDGQKNRHDDESWLQKFTPRGKKSVWSRINRGHVERLAAAGRMRAGGIAAVEAAKADGRWERAYDSPATATVPDDLQAALDGDPAAKAVFAALKRHNRYAVLFRVQTAVKPETRARRIADLVAMLARGETPHP